MSSFPAPLGGRVPNLVGQAGGAYRALLTGATTGDGAAVEKLATALKVDKESAARLALGEVDKLRLPADQVQARRDRLTAMLGATPARIARHEPTALDTATERRASALEPIPPVHRQTLHTQGWIEAVAYSPDGTTAAMKFAEVVNLPAMEPHSVVLWDLRTGQRLSTLPLNGLNDSSALAFSPDGKSVAVGSSSGRVAVLDVASGRVRVEFQVADPVLEKKKCYVASLGFDRSGSTIITSSDADVKAFDAQTGALRRVVHESESRIYAAGWSVGAGRLVTGNYDGHLRMFDDSGAELGNHPHWYLRNGIDSVAVSAGGSRMAVAYGRPIGSVIEVMDGAGKSIARIERGRNNVTSLALSPDGSLLVTAGLRDYGIEIWDSETGALLHEIDTQPGVEEIEFSPDGTRILVRERHQVSEYQIARPAP